VVSEEVAEFSSFMANAERKLAEDTEWKNTFTSPGCQPVFRIRIHRIHMFLGLLDPDPSVRGMDPDPDPSVIMQK
jgi:hypothetical protein